MNFNRKIFYALGCCIIFWVWFILAVSGCDTVQADPYKPLYEEQLLVSDSLQQKVTELEKNIDTLYAVSEYKVDSLKQVNSALQLNINNLNARIDSLVLFYADLTNAANATDTMLTIVNNKVIDLIQSMRIK